SRFFKIARQRSFDPDARTWLSRTETRGSLVLMCAPLAGSIRSRPSTPRSLARHSSRWPILLLARRSQTLSHGPGVNQCTEFLGPKMVLFGAFQGRHTAYGVG